MGNTLQKCRVAPDGFTFARVLLRHFAALIVLPLLIHSALSAGAAEYCVGTVAELETALDDVASSSTALFITTVRIRQGSYNLGTSRMTRIGRQTLFNALELLGGYSADCSARTLNPDNTIFNAQGASQFRFEPLGNLLIEGIRFENISGATKQVDVWSAADNITASIRNNAFVGVGFFGVSGSTSDIDFVENTQMRFINNRVTGFPGGSFTAVRMAALSKIRFTGNTLADNLGSHATEFCANSTDLWLVDNIAWNNSGDDFRVFA
jgi:hypothetical protein